MPTMTIGEPIATDTGELAEQIIDSLAALRGDGDKTRTFLHRVIETVHDRGRKEGVASRNDLMATSIGRSIDAMRETLDAMDARLGRRT